MLSITPSSPRIPHAARRLATAFYDASGKLKDRNTAEYIGMRRAMGRNYLMWLQKSDAVGARVTAENAFVVAGRLAEVWKETSEASWAEEAASVFENILAGAYEGKVSVGPDAVLLKLARVQAGLQKWQKARDVYERLAVSKGDYADILLELAEVHLAVSRSASGDEQTASWRAAYDLFRKVLTSIPPEKRHLEPCWWRAMYGYVTVLYESGEYKQAYEGIKGVQIVRPEFDNGEYRPKLEALLRELDNRLPRR